MTASFDDVPDFASPSRFGQPADPFTTAIDADHPAAPHARAAADLLDGGSALSALDAAAQARRLGVPAELAPHLAIVEGIAASLAGNSTRAILVLSEAWSAHPDVAALPAALGAAQLAIEDATSAAHSMYAALVSDDPDHSLVIHRRRLTLLLGALRDAR